MAFAEVTVEKVYASSSIVALDLQTEVLFCSFNSGEMNNVLQQSW